MLDTNIVSDIAKNPSGAAAERFAAMAADDLSISVVVSAEIEFGMAKSTGDRYRSMMSPMLESLDVKQIDRPVDRIYGSLRAQLAAEGRALSPNDYWIAAHALALDATLVTDDAAFSNVQRLKLENWLRG